MIKTFSPGHITCFFHPMISEDILSTGSRGVGIKLSLGTKTIVEERNDSLVNIQINNKKIDAPISEKIISKMAPNQGFDVYIENQLPMGQGFGMSASGALSISLALSKYSDKKPDIVAHATEVELGGGLGDVSAILTKSHHPIRISPGIPPYGKITDGKIKFDKLSLIILGDKLTTSSVISKPEIRKKMFEIGSNLIDVYSRNPNIPELFSFSRAFSKNVCLESKEVTEALDKINEISLAGMCMLGHSIFTLLNESEIKEILGENVSVYECQSSDVVPSFI